MGQGAGMSATTCERVTFEAKFPLGAVVATPGVLDALPPGLLPLLLRRHARGDWGEVDPSDARANDAAIRDGERVLSSYAVGDTKVWIITEWDRSVTTALLPEEY